MHAEAVMTERSEDTESESQGEFAKRRSATGFSSSLLDVLMPQTPPEPKNARIVRQFDIEAAKNDEGPVTETAPARRPQHERRTRAEARALRNRSLAAAAGLD